jgi:hypothetical protein
MADQLWQQFSRRDELPFEVAETFNGPRPIKPSVSVAILLEAYIGRVQAAAGSGWPAFSIRFRWKRCVRMPNRLRKQFKIPGDTLQVRQHPSHAALPVRCRSQPLATPPRRHQ